MAGDWIPWTVGLSRKREVLAIARATGLHRRMVACILMEFWEWADSQTEDGLLNEISPKSLCEVVADTQESFWCAVAEVGWLRFEGEQRVEIPNFGRWMGESAKKRVANTQRQRERRAVMVSRYCRAIPESLRKEVMQRDGRRCVYCGLKEEELRLPWVFTKLSIDHVIPVTRGGQTVAENLVCCCGDCNNHKNNRTPEEAGMEMRFLRNGVFLSRNFSDSCATTEQNRTEHRDTPKPPEGVGAGEFEQFWKIYPRKTAKAKAAQAWRALAPATELQALILAAVERQKRWAQWQRGVIPHAASWLNQRRWEDEEPGAAAAPSEEERRQRVQAQRDELRRMEAEAFRNGSTTDADTVRGKGGAS